MSKLIFFTNTFPYGIGELWKYNELKLLAKEFEKVEIVPYSFAKSNSQKNINISNVVIIDPLVPFDIVLSSKFECFSLFFSRFFLSDIQEVVRAFKKFQFVNIIKFLIALKRRNILLNSSYLNYLLKSDDLSNTVIYFYWGLGSSEIIPFVDVKKFKNVIVRMHRYDLYEYENDGYIPFRKQLLNKKIYILPCSDDGTYHLSSHYSNFKAILKTQRLGVLNPKKVSKGSEDGVLRIVSCSSLVRVKRIELMIAAAAQLGVPFKWIHIGGGELNENLELEILKFNLQDRFFLIGEINSELVIDFLVKENFDLFINTSRSEGVPVSIMEAFSVGIPVIATDAGGTKEIVDQSVGCLLRNELEPIELKSAIENYYYLSNEDKVQIRQNAFSRFENKCDMEKLTQQFIEILNK